MEQKLDLSAYEMANSLSPTEAGRLEDAATAAIDALIAHNGSLEAAAEHVGVMLILLAVAKGQRHDAFVQTEREMAARKAV